MFIELLILIVISLLLYQRWLKRDIYELGRQLNSGIMCLPFIGHSYLFIGNDETRLKAFQIFGRDAIRKEDGLTAVWHGSYLYTFVADPEAAMTVLKTCLEKDDLVEMLRTLVGNGSIFAPVSTWRPRRKVLLPSFSIKNLKYFMSIFAKQSKILVHKIGKMAGAGCLPAFNYFTAFTMDAIAESTMGYKMNAQENMGHPFLKAFDEGISRASQRICQPWLHNDLVYTNLPLYPKLMEKKEYLWRFVTELIRAKRDEIKEKDSQEYNENSPESLTTFMEYLIRSSRGDHGYTDVEIVEELMVLMIAGNDTSAVGTSFVSVMLSRYPEVQEKVYLELQEVFGDSDRPITFDDLPRLKYLDAVIKETLRLYPPVPVITRKVESVVELPSGIKLVPGTGVVVHIWALHRNPRYWGDDAELFRPERFIDTTLKHPAAFMPFSHGPRNCVGYQYAMMSMKTAISSVLRQYRILPAIVPDHNSEHPPLRLKFNLMMKDVNNFQIKIESRV